MLNPEGDICHLNQINFKNPLNMLTLQILIKSSVLFTVFGMIHYFQSSRFILTDLFL